MNERRNEDVEETNLVVEIVTLTSALTDTGEDGVTTMRLGNVVDELHDKHGLADTGTTKQTDLATLRVRRKEVDDLDTRDEDLSLDLHVGKGRGLGVDRAALSPASARQ